MGLTRKSESQVENAQSLVHFDECRAGLGKVGQCHLPRKFMCPVLVKIENLMECLHIDCFE